jgi:CoA:oxalate CoA-transferase
MNKVLSGIKVLECAHFISGTHCAQILSDHGAEVVKLEPLDGDPSRKSPPIWNDWSLYFAAHNRGKKSIAANIKTVDGRRILDRLIEWADVIVTNYTSGAVERLGLDYASASRLNRRVVVVRISAFGATGSERDVPGFDGTIQARTGLAHMIGPPDRPPTVTSVPVIDYLAAVEGAFAAMLGLQGREQTGEGQELDVSMMDAASTVLGYLYAEVLTRGNDPMRSGSRAPYAVTGAYEAKDGWVYIAPIGVGPWTALCELIGRPEWADDGAPYRDPEIRVRERSVVEAALTDWTRKRTRDELTDILFRAGVPCGRVNSVFDAAGDGLLREREMLQTVRLGSSGHAAPMPGVEIKLNGSGSGSNGTEEVVPELGGQTGEVLSSLGFSDEEMTAWRTGGIVR